MPGRSVRRGRRARSRPARSLLVVPTLVVLVVGASACIPLRSVQPVAAGTIVFDSSRDGPNFEIYAMDSDGTDLVQLTDDDAYDSWWPRLSPDRHTILFFGTATTVGAPAWVDDTHFLVHKVVPPGGFQIHRVDAVTLAATNLTPNWPGNNEYPAS